MKETLKKHLGFPYAKKHEEAFKKQIVMWMYKPLLLLVVVVACLLLSLVWASLYMSEWIAPPSYIPLVTAFHMGLLGITGITLCLAVLFRRQYYEKPGLYMVFSTSYAVAVMVWSSLLSSYVNFSNVIDMAFSYVSFIVALVITLKPWQALLLFGGDYCLYVVLITFVWPPTTPLIESLFSAGLAMLFSTVIASIFYRYRTRTFFDRLTIERQVAQLNTANQTLKALIHTDPLTGLYNRRFFDEALPALLQQEPPPNRWLCSMMLDVDFFKLYNDRYGHQAGDICLRRVADVVTAALELSPVYTVRYGGEEFFIAAFAKTPAQAQHQAEEIRKAVEDCHTEHLDHPQGRVTVSIGLYVAPAGTPLAQATQQADDALYQAKAQGRNRVVAVTEK